MRVVGNHIRDVSPDSDLIEFGGRYTPTQQRGHGICLYGQGHLVADNLLTNLNDDMIYIGASFDVEIRGNVALGSGVYHGNSYENITVFQVGGDVTITGNVAGGAQLALLLQDREPNSRVFVEDNLFLQDHGRTVVADRSGAGAGPAVFENNVFVGAYGEAVALEALGAPAVYRGNYFLDVTVRDARHLEGSVLIASGRFSQPLVVDPGVLRSNLISAPQQEAGRALVLLSEAAGEALIHSNAFDPGAGASVRHSSSSSAEYWENLTTGPLFGLGSRATPALVVKNNVSTAALWVDRGVPIRVSKEDGNWFAQVSWRDRESLLPECGVGGAGYEVAGLARSGGLPLRPSGPLAVRQASDDDILCAAVEPVAQVRGRQGSGCQVGRGGWPPWFFRR
jgi:hypothetical protein